MPITVQRGKVDDLPNLLVLFPSDSTQTAFASVNNERRFFSPVISPNLQLSYQSMQSLTNNIQSPLPLRDHFLDHYFQFATQNLENKPLKSQADNLNQIDQVYRSVETKLLQFFEDSSFSRNDCNGTRRASLQLKVSVKLRLYMFRWNSF